MYELTKDVTLSDGRKFQVGRFRADVGNWVLTHLKNATEEEYYRIQKHCLKTCTYMNGAGPEAVIMEDGRWIVKDLEFNTMAVTELINASLEFNFSDFFNKSSAEEKVIPGQAADRNAP